MHLFAKKTKTAMKESAFTLVEMLVVIAIISILMTAGVVGINSMGGKGVSSGVATAESVFDEARTTAIGKNVRACVLVAKELTSNPNEDLRRMMVAYEEIETDKANANFGKAKLPLEMDVKNLNWVLSSRAVVLPDQTFFSQLYSAKSHETGGDLDVIASTKIKDVKKTYAGNYVIYPFNAQGICSPAGQTAGEAMSFIIGSGVRNATKSGIAELPKVTGSAKKDFGGFVVWRNGSTSVFRSPDQMGSGVKGLKSGDKF